VAAVTAVPLFGVSLLATLVAARLFARRLDQLGARLGFPEALVGLLTALAADGPEISSALFALARGEHRTSVGVLVGSNAFNLAAMIGVSGLVVGGVRLSRDTLLLEGLLGTGVTWLGVAVLLGWLSAPLAALGAACLLLPYLLLVIGGSELLAHGRRATHFTARLRHTLDQPAQMGRAHSSGNPTHHLVALIALDVAVIVAGSAGMVQAALALANHWGISRAVLGMLILAPLTSLPNAITAMRLGLAHRGAALVGETFNSNTINLIAGVIAPALFVTLTPSTATAKLQLGWLVGMTCICMLLLAPSGGMRRPGAAALVALYGGFIALQLVLT
jgi:cation:H+ antiporter